MLRPGFLLVRTGHGCLRAGWFQASEPYGPLAIARGFVLTFRHDLCILLYRETVLLPSLAGTPDVVVTFGMWWRRRRCSSRSCTARSRIQSTANASSFTGQDSTDRICQRDRLFGRCHSARQSD